MCFTRICHCPFGPQSKSKQTGQPKQDRPADGPSKPIPSRLGLHALSCKPASPRPSACFMHDQAFAQQGLPTWLHPSRHAWPLASLMQLPHADRDTRTAAVSSLPTTRPPVHSLPFEDPQPTSPAAAATGSLCNVRHELLQPSTQRDSRCTMRLCSALEHQASPAWRHSSTSSTPACPFTFPARPRPVPSPSSNCHSPLPAFYCCCQVCLQLPSPCYSRQLCTTLQPVHLGVWPCSVTTCHELSPVTAAPIAYGYLIITHQLAFTPTCSARHASNTICLPP